MPRQADAIRFHHHHVVIASQGCRIIPVTELPAVTPEYFEILVVRELRKVGFDVGTVRIHRRSELPEPERGFVLELVVPLARGGETWRALVACRHQTGAVDREVVESVKARLPQVPADAAVVFATADFAADALAAAREAGVAMLRVVDGRTAFDTSGWSTPGHYPAWLPAYLPQLVDRDISGQPRARLLEAGRPDMILDCFQIEKERRHG
ncbi:MAG: hypothetical protein AUG85_06430 [Gemmatimonadetes bacterium 13_1_20CM_4_66_11]|nr:MAG: hypothetical protein AUI86_06570 [Gemmatimonadetes bacterium 13_1_40CM_3_66_12]OLD87735.1 MAG: hypothetical protein AUG85_06430 [Gemmatimonadetes bacterium 13_1_20CM_4_66_11]